MAIENGLLQSRKGFGAESTEALYLNRKGEAICRLHHKSVVVSAPVWIGVLAGAESAQPKPHRSFNPIIRLRAVNLKENHSDLPQLRNRMQESWKACGRTTAVPLRSVR